jgi:hypothetical protein
MRTVTALSRAKSAGLEARQIHKKAQVTQLQSKSKQNHRPFEETRKLFRRLWLIKHPLFSFNLKSAMETAKQAKYTNWQWLPKKGRFTCGVKRWGASEPCFGLWFSRGSRRSRLFPTAEFGFNDLPCYVNSSWGVNRKKRLPANPTSATGAGVAISVVIWLGF